MSCKSAQICRKFSLILCFMLFLQASYSQYDFNEAEYWMKDNLNDLGGRSVLILVKDGKIIYEQAENDLSQKQEMIGKIISKRQSYNADEMLQDYSGTSVASIAGCSNWLSNISVMTFSDEAIMLLPNL